MLLQNFKAMTIIMRVRKCLGGKLLGLQDKSPAIKGILEFFAILMFGQKRRNCYHY